MPKISLEVTFEMESAFHFGGGKGAGSNTALILRDDKDHAYLPGSAVKGKVRYYVQMFCSEGDVNILFGEPGNSQGLLSFSDFTSDSDTLQTERRAGNKINPYTRTAEDNMLFTIEAERVDTLIGTVRGNISEDQLNILKGSLKMITHIGGNTSRGLGVVKNVVVRDTIVDENVGDSTDEKDILSGRYKVDITPRAPLFFGKHTSKNNFRDTLDYIPGETFRAATAKAITGKFGQKDNSLDVDKLSISAFSPIGAIPTPLTAKQCKYQKAHKVIDTLAQLLHDEHTKGEPTDFRCPDCGGEMERPSAWLTTEGYSKFELDKRISTHSAIDSFRGVAADGQLFSRRYISPSDDLKFTGYIAVKAELKKYKRLQIGALQSAGYGRVCVEYLPEPISDDIAIREIKERIVAFNELLPERANAYYIPILVLSDVLIPEGISKWEKLFPKFTLYKIIASTRQVRRVYTGDDESRSHYDFRLQLNMGSIFVLKEKELTDDVLKRLIKLERSIELEGSADKLCAFQALRIADEFHTKRGKCHER